MAHLTVNLIYYKKTGKFYSSGDFLVCEDTPLHVIWDIVAHKSVAGNLPGLVFSTHAHDFIISIDVPGHEHEHPHLMIP